MSEQHIGILLLFGISIILGIISSLFFSKIKIPQVLGYIVTGLVIGQTGFKLIDAAAISRLSSFNFFALGIIGFLVGSEIKVEHIKKYGKQFSLILLFEGIFAFILVTTAVFAILFMLTDNISIALAGGIVFGAIASATDPASTVNVIWEYRAAGVLTTTIIAIVALDDALAMFLYGMGTGISQVVTGGESQVLLELARVVGELFLSIGVGVAGGFLLSQLVKQIKKHDTLFVFSFGILLLLIGICVFFDLDVILASMFCGIVMVNTIPLRSEEVVQQIQAISTPIYILFFVLVGARMDIGNMPSWLWIIVIAYVLLRSLGKYSGALIGAKLSGSDPKVIKFTGLSLFAQGGVAIGLSIMASQHLSEIMLSEHLSLGDIIIFGVTATTLIVQMIGPIAVKMSLIWADETEKNISIEDIIAEWKVKNALQPEFTNVHPQTNIREIFKLFTEISYSFLPVVDQNGRFMGILDFQDVKYLLDDQTTWDWLIAVDFIRQIKEIAHSDDNLEETLITMEQINHDQLPVVDSAESMVLVGIADKQYIMQSARNELLERCGTSAI